jgi:hypothetical protein
MLRTGINHRDDDTTAICEGFYSVIKSLLRATEGEGQRVDKLIYFLLNTLSDSSPIAKCGGITVRFLIAP